MPAPSALLANSAARGGSGARWRASWASRQSAARTTAASADGTDAPGDCIAASHIMAWAGQGRQPSTAKLDGEPRMAVCGRGGAVPIGLEMKKLLSRSEHSSVAMQLDALEADATRTMSLGETMGGRSAVACEPQQCPLSNGALIESG